MSFRGEAAWLFGGATVIGLLFSVPSVMGFQADAAVSAMFSGMAWAFFVVRRTHDRGR